MTYWGDESMGKCDHGVDARTCLRCRRGRWDDAEALLVAALAVAGFLLLGRAAADREAVADRLRLQDHQEQLERAHPGAAQRLDELAREQRVRPGGAIR